MFKIDSDKTTIKCTRGDKGRILIRKKTKNSGVEESFYKGDKVIFTVKNNFSGNEVLLRKVVEVENDCDSVELLLNKDDTTIGDLIASPIKYQYDISINGDITILGYDDDGPKIFQLYPEGSDDR